MLQDQPLTPVEQGKLLFFIILLAPAVFFLIGIVPALFLGFGVYMMKKNKNFAYINAAVKNFKIFTFVVLIGSLISALYFGAEYTQAMTQIRSNVQPSHIEGNRVDIEQAATNAMYWKSYGFETESPPQLEIDLRTMSPEEIKTKYGSNDAFRIIQARIDARNSVLDTVDSWSEPKEGFIFSSIGLLIALAYFIAVGTLFYKPLSRHSAWVARNAIFSTSPDSLRNLNPKTHFKPWKCHKRKQFSIADELLKWAELKDKGLVSENEFNQMKADLLKNK
ncbi:MULTISPECIES: SHOCT domain-containing protein [Methylophaga]|jgi:hypothetical protein|uniref:SHOCT domain-containing protein n=1 Tax=Methylophaga TaxID=40222 RepID=UPI000C49B46B|nr:MULTISPECIES: SHOCT domain-containing protein [Methylophaga]MAX51729.1 hypothetical protein [Methylophaga sp.]WVI83987.1 SHOCT domain-containing protein [Methylophaga thalassica]|tara:strand:+ start:17599 stop:18432 length:834 start_codon:yes stop_codon:yes gene_type:complete